MGGKESGFPRANADGLLPAGVPIIHSVVFDRAANNLNRSDAAADDGLSGDNIPIAVPGVFNAVAGDVDRARSVESGESGLNEGLPASGSYVRDLASADWNATREGLAGGGAITSQGVQTVSQHFFDSAGVFRPVRSVNATPDGTGLADIPSIHNTGFNNTSLDRWRNNIIATLLASAARTVQTDSALQTNFNHRGVIALIDVSLDPSTASITPNILARETISTANLVILAGAAIAAVGESSMVVYPGGAGAWVGTGVELDSIIPRAWLFRMTVADAETMTYSVEAQSVV